MSGFQAILIEDERMQADRVSEVLRGGGFASKIFVSGSSARAGFDALQRPIDLVVADRRIPENGTDEPEDLNGDRLLEEMLARFTDTPFVVFTAHTSIPHSQWSTRDRGVIPLTGANSFDRVAHFEKTDYIGFDKYVRKVGSALTALKVSVEVIGVDGDDPRQQIRRRLIRKLALQYGATVVHADLLDGGLTSAVVYRCEFVNSSGVSVAKIVVKIRPRVVSPRYGGLSSSLDSKFIAGGGPVVYGMCDGLEAQVFQLADTRPVPLMTLAKGDDAKAADAVATLAAGYSRCLSPTRSSTSLAAFVRQLIEWDDLVSVLEGYELTPPDASLMISSAVVSQHGDLHPFNILVSQGDPVLIDFDSETISSIYLDPLYLALSFAFHKASPFRESEWCDGAGLIGLTSGSLKPTGEPSQTIAATLEWLRALGPGGRDRWAIALGFSARQLEYKDVQRNDRLRNAPVMLAAESIRRLNEE